jgi:sugar/nucleoside kinase (ribokinase family)
MKQRPQRLVMVGSVLVDILLTIPHLPQAGGDVLAQQAQITSGGGFNVLIGAKRLGMPVLCACRIGDGPMGSQIRADLQKAEIPLALGRIDGEDNGFDVGLIESDAERTFVTSPGTESRLRMEDLRTIALRAGDAIYVSGYDLCYPVSGAALEEWLPTLSADHLLVLDPGPLVAEIPEQRLRRVLARTDILSLNARELVLLTGETEVVMGTKKLASRIRGGGWIVARVGAQGCWLASSEQEPRLCPARHVQAVDTTGAGDAHVAALLARLYRDNDMGKATEIANVAAALSVTKRGPATGPTQEELSRALAESVCEEGGA